MRDSRIWASLILLALAGCGDDRTAAEGGETEGAPQLGGPARGISIVGIEANQGTAVILTEGVTYLEPDQRNAYLVRNRDTLVRFQHAIADPDAWIPRELVGLLHVYPPDGADEQVYERRLFVEADSDPRNINTNFYFGLLADDAAVGTRFWLELRESEDGVDVSALAEGLASAPAEPEPFGFEPSAQEIRVVLVPVDYQWVDPPRLTEPTADDIQLFHDDLLQQNPVHTIDIQVREQPLVWDDQLTNLGTLLGPTAALKADDGAAANVYYHALVDIGGPSVNMVAGIALLADASAGDSDRRVAATVFYKQYDAGDEETGEPPKWFPPTGSSRTWVHELGHNQGLRHVACPGADAANPDPGYPYTDGKIGVHGFGIRNFHMYTPGAAHDYMSYCGNSWVSDWTWNKTFERVRTLTAWDYEGAPAPATQPVLVGLLFADGSEDWWCLDAARPDAGPSAERLQVWADGQLIDELDVELELLSDGETRMLRAPLPTAVTGLDALTRVDARGRSHAIDLGRVREGRAFARANRARAR